MRRSVQVVLSSLLFVLLFVQISAAVEPGSWTTSGSMSVARNGAVAVDLKDGRVLVVGGTAPDGSILATAEFLNVDGTFTPAPSMSVGRVGHSALYLDSGAVVVFGGKTASGITATAELYDPAANAWFTLPNAMHSPRAWLSAVRLNDGNVLLLGGVNDSAPVASFEVFDTWTLEFAAAGSLITARKDAAATALADGRVMIAGGSDVAGNTLNSTEIVDLSKGTVAVGPIMTVPRTNASLTLLLDGRLLVAGGRYPEAPVNGVVELNSAELLDAAAGTSMLVPAPMTVARGGHRAYRLVDNNGVLIVGGTSGDQDVASAEIFIPWTGQFVATPAMASAHKDAAGLSLSGVAVVAGGSDQSSSEVYGFGTVRTDKADYQPGEFVTITGAGWVPGELVSIAQQQFPANTGVLSYEIPADENGKFSVSDYAPTTADLNTAYLLTAVGSKSQAQVAFTDAKSVTVAFVGAGTGLVTSNPAGISCSDNAGTATGTCVGSFSNSATVTLTASTGTGSTVTNWNVPGYTINSGCTAGATTCKFTMNNTGQTVTVTIKANQAALTVSAPGSITYGNTGTAAATGGSGTGAVSFSAAASTGCSVAGTTVTVTNASGTCSLTATKAADSNYNAATSAAFAVTLNKATPTVSIWPTASTINYGQTLVSSTLNGGSASVTGSFAFMNPATSPNAGTSAQSVTFAPSDVSNYNTIIGSVNVTVNQATPTVSTWPSASAITYGQRLTSSTLSGGSASVTGSFAFTNPSTAPNVGSGAQSVTFTPADTTNYSAVTGSVSVTVGKATPTVSTWPSASAITYGQTLTSSTLSGGSASVPGTFAFTTPSTAPNAGTGSQTVTFTPSDTNSYNSVTGAANVAVNKAVLTVTAADHAMTYGGAVPTLTFAIAGFVNGESASVLSGAPSVTTTATSASNVGSYTITPSIGSLSAANYSFSFVEGTLTIGKAQLTITAANTSKTYGAALPALTYVATGFVNGETETVLAGTPSITTTATATSSVGVYPITIAIGSLSSANYDFNFANGTLTVGKAMLTITADSKSMTYGGAVPSYSYKASGFVNGDTESVLTGTPNYNTTTSAVGTYPIVISAGSLSAANYDFALVNGTLTVSKAMLTITADSKSMTYGGTVPTLTYVVTGFLNGDSEAVLTGTPGLSTAATQASAVGTYAINAATGSLVAENYDLNFVGGTLTVNRAPLVISAVDTSMTYGGPMLSFTFAANGFVNGDTAAVLTAQPTITTPATVTSGVGGYALNVSGATAANYTISYQPGNLTITKAPLTVTANNVSKSSGQANPTLTGVITGVKNGDPIAATYSTTAVTSSPAGTYPITVASVTDNGTGALSNYLVNMVSGTLTVLAGKADLVESNFSYMGTPATGGILQVTETVTNQGGATAGMSATSFFISNGTTKMYLGTRYLPEIASGATSTSTMAVALPTSLVGSYFLMACADANNQVAEADESNNCASSTSFAILAADLVESAVTMVTATPGSGAVVQVSDTVTNQGGGAAGNSATHFYLSSDGIAKNTSLGARYLGTIAAGGTSTVTSALTLPTGIMGKYYLIACADQGNAVAESNESNNCTASAQFTVAGPDLTETAVSVTSTAPVAGGAIQVSDTTSNQGLGGAGNSATYLYLSKTGTTKDYSLGARYLASIAAGGSSTGTSTLTLPAGVNGTFYLLACADQNNAVAETNEINNCKASASFSVAGADLVESTVDVLTASPTVGGTIQVSDSVLNQGAGAAANSASYIYLSSDGTVRSYSLGARYLGSLAAGASSTATTTLALPAGVKGTYSILICADATNTNAESNEANNCTASSSFVIR